MEIFIKKNYGYELHFKTTNVDVVEDIESREYKEDENGKIFIKRDIKTDILEQFISVLDDMAYYRTTEFDSSNLISTLFEKLPNEVAIELVNKLKNNYIIENE
jgi:hypothetical protein